MALRIEPPTDDYDRAGFSSGTPDLDRWLRDHATIATGQGTRTYLLIHAAGKTIAGYFSIAPYIVERETAPQRIARGAPAQIPSILLAKLALASDLQGQGLGGELLVRCLMTIIDAARQAGGRLIVVDAIDAQAELFYRHHDFRPMPAHHRRLVMKMSTAAKALGQPWP